MTRRFERLPFRVCLIIENNTFAFWLIDESDDSYVDIIQPKWAWSDKMRSEVIEDHGAEYIHELSGMQCSMRVKNIHDLGEPQYGWLKITQPGLGPDSLLVQHRFFLRDGGCVHGVRITDQAQLVEILPGVSA